VKVDVTVPWEDVEYGVEETIDEQDEANEERSQQYSRRTIPLTQHNSIVS